MSGSFTAQNKVLPGVYVNFQTTQPLSIQVGQRGVVMLPLCLDWGDKGQLIRVTKDTNTSVTLGRNYTDIVPLREAMKNANTVLVYKINGGTKAQAEAESGVLVKAVKPGTAGNRMALRLTDNGQGKFAAETYLDGTLMDAQTIANYEEFQPNGLVCVEGTGVAKSISVTLTGGTDEEEQTADYETFMQEAGKQFFNTMAYVGKEEEVKTLLTAFVKQMRSEEGKRIQAVMQECTADTEGIISVCQGVELEDGTQLSAGEMCAYVAGMTAGAAINESCTNHTVQGAVDVVPHLTKTQLEEQVKQGQMVFRVDASSRVSVVYDINTCVSASAEGGQDMRKNRVVRVLDGIHDDIVSIFEGSYLGKVHNNTDGRSLLKGSLVEYFQQLSEQNAIQGFDAEDVTVEAGLESDSVVITVTVSPVDSCEKFYITVNVG